MLQAVLAHDIPHEILSAEQVNERFPGYRLPANFRVCMARHPHRMFEHSRLRLQRRLLTTSSGQEYASISRHCHLMKVALCC